MTNFKFDGPNELYYPTLGVTALPGDVVELPEAPDAFWSATSDAVTPDQANDPIVEALDEQAPPAAPEPGPAPVVAPTN